MKPMPTTERDLRNTRAGIYTALELLEQGRQAQATSMLRSCLPEDYLPVGLGGDPNIAVASLADGDNR